MPTPEHPTATERTRFHLLLWLLDMDATAVDSFPYRDRTVVFEETPEGVILSVDAIPIGPIEPNSAEAALDAIDYLDRLCIIINNAGQ